MCLLTSLYGSTVKKVVGECVSILYLGMATDISNLP